MSPANRHTLHPSFLANALPDHQSSSGTGTGNPSGGTGGGGTGGGTGGGGGK
jgi:hypothetical protein